MKMIRCVWRLAALCLLPASLAIVAPGCSWTPVQVAVLDPMQVAPPEDDVYGVRVNLIYGRNANVYGLDVGVWNEVVQSEGALTTLWQEADTESDGRAAGLRLGIYDVTREMWGAQIGGMISMARADMKGIQLAGVMSGAGEARGIQCSLFANVARKAEGMQLGIGMMNMAGALQGLQVGPCENTADKMQGLQVGWFINGANRAQGGQVAPLNLCLKRPAGRLPAGRATITTDQGYAQGVQIGLVNYSYEMSGPQIGLINIIRKGPIPFFPGLNIGWKRSAPPESAPETKESR